MLIKNVKVNNSRLVEGKYYPFQILKTIHLEPENPLYVLTDPLGYKVLMPKKYYLHYGFKEGQLIQCRVDKINCNGRMFLEPLHPHYSEGNYYDFPIIEKGVQKNILNKDEQYLKVQDVFKQNWIVRFSSDELSTLKSITIKCKLDRIKKGKLFLSIATDVLVDSFLQIGNTYEFLVVGERKNVENQVTYWILEDKFGIHHPLVKKYYIHYGIQIGQKIKCTVDKFTSEGYFFLEPENPWYKTGENYHFKILELNKLIFSDGAIQDVLVLDDPYGEVIKIFVEAQTVNQLKNKTEVSCKVKRIRKSRFDLELTE